MTPKDPCGPCSVSACGGCPQAGVSRRGFLAGSLALPALRSTSAAGVRDPARQAPIAQPLAVQPVLLYETPQRRPATSWRAWGGIQTEQDAAAEQERIRRELFHVSSQAGFRVQIRPLAAVKSPEQAAALAREPGDVRLVYAAGGSAKALEALTPPDRWNLLFLRHRSGPVYLWYEIAHPRYLRKTVDDYGQPGMRVEDVVVDDQADLLARLRGLYGLKNTLGKRIVAVGGPSGWGEGGRTAPDRARELWKLDIRTVSY